MPIQFESKPIITSPILKFPNSISVIKSKYISKLPISFTLLSLFICVTLPIVVVFVIFFISDNFTKVSFNNMLHSIPFANILLFFLKLVLSSGYIILLFTEFIILLPK